MAIALSDLRTAILQRADLIDASGASPYLTTAELNSYINSSASELYDHLITTYEDYNITGPTEFTITSITDSGDAYTLPDDFYKLRKIQRQATQTPNQWLRIRPFNFSEDQWSFFGGGNISGNSAGGAFYHTSYTIKGQELYLEPYQTANGTYRIWYTPYLPALVADGDTLPGYMSGPAWHEYIIVDCVIKAIEKQEDDPSVFMAQKEALLTRIQGVAMNRDEGDTPTIGDVYGRSRRGPYGSGGW